MADSGEAASDGGESDGGQARRGDRVAGEARRGRSGGFEGEEAAADEEDGGEKETLDESWTRRVHRDPFGERLLRRRQGQRTRRLPLLPRELALQSMIW